MWNNIYGLSTQKIERKWVSKTYDLPLTVSKGRKTPTRTFLSAQKFPQSPKNHKIKAAVKRKLEGNLHTVTLTAITHLCVYYHTTGSIRQGWITYCACPWHHLFTKRSRTLSRTGNAPLRRENHLINSRRRNSANTLELQVFLRNFK